MHFMVNETGTFYPRMIEFSDDPLEANKIWPWFLDETTSDRGAWGEPANTMITGFSLIE